MTASWLAAMFYGNYSVFVPEARQFSGTTLFLLFGHECWQINITSAVRTQLPGAGDAGGFVYRGNR